MLNGRWQINWTAPEGNPQPHRTAGSNHPGGAQFAFADGSVRFVTENIQHTATTWNVNRPYATAKDQPYGTYQRLFSIGDGLQVSGLLGSVVISDPRRFLRSTTRNRR